jgi:hypothetical protein
MTLPLSIGYKLAAELPDATLRIVPDAMHSLPAEKPLIAIELVREAASGRPFPRYENPPHASPR